MFPSPLCITIIVLMMFITFLHESSPFSTMFRFSPVTWLPLSHLLIHNSFVLSFVFFYACKLFACMMELALNIWSCNSFSNK